MHVAFLGFGLIAGSIARAVRANPVTIDWTLAAWSPSGDGPRHALHAGIVDRAPEEAEAVLEGADLVVLAAPATDCLELVERLAGPWRPSVPPDALVTDVASTKAMIVGRADRAGLRFVGGHPMAGRETTGFDAAEADLFVDRPWIIVPGALATAADRERVADLARACSARPIELDAVAHDRAVAGISHLPLLLAVALVEAVAGRGDAVADDWPELRDLAAGGWRDMTRLARGEPGMGAGIVVTNAPALAERVRDVRSVLDGWLEELERGDGPDEAAVAARLAAARALLDAPR